VSEHDAAECDWSNPEETSAEILSDHSENPLQSPQSQEAEVPATVTEPGKDAAERIHQLEQALDASLNTVRSLQSQLKDQQLLETQLAATEETATLQQQAMAQLKQQVSDQQQALEAELIQAQLKDQTIAELFASVEALVQAQQGELSRLKTQLSEDSSAIKLRQKQLEAELAQRQKAQAAQEKQVRQLEAQTLDARNLTSRLEIELAAAHQEIKAMYAHLSDRAYSIKQLETTLQHSQTLIAEQNSTITALHRQIEALESQLAQQVKIQARLQQSCQELTEDRTQYKARSSELEYQRATLQEQILMQAQQAREYEATIQYWKDHCNISQRQTQQLKEVLHRVLPDARAELSELLITLQPSADIEIPPLPPVIAETSAPPASSKGLQVDLPDFLRKTSTGQRSRKKTK